MLGCNIHDNMVGWIVVVETPYHGQTDASGSVRLADVPPGTYRLRSWNPALPPGTAPMEETFVVPAGTASATVKLPLTAAAL